MNGLLRTAFLLLCVLLPGLVGCSRSTAPPAPLALEQIPAELQKAYAKAVPELKEAVAQLTTSLRNKDYTTAYQTVQNLINAPAGTKDQRLVAVRSMMTINTLLQAAQAQGDSQAAAVLTRQKMLK